MSQNRNDPYDYKQLRKQIAWQREHHFDLQADVNWGAGIDFERFFLPVDHDAVAFPGANERQRKVLSQLMGLIVNATISEMEEVAGKLKSVAWRRVLNDFPVNPEMEELGELFFEEEEKHSQLFRKYNETFLKQTGIEANDLDRILPKAFGSSFQTAIKKNAEFGGHAFWWVVALVEEVAVLIYQQMYRHRRKVDPLFYQIHRKHFEEESKHTQYAFMMLQIINDKCHTLKDHTFKRTDLLFSEVFSTSWVLSELHKIFEVESLKDKHPFFMELSTCLPLLKQMPASEVVRRLFISAPYISLILNRNYHQLSLASAVQHKALKFYYPKPKLSETIVELERLWKTAG